MSAVAPLAPGVIIAETYEVERQVGKGGMGEVWLARHRRLAGKQVAIKVLHVDRALPQEALARFRREAEIAARLEHPNIVQVLDFNTLPTGQPYLVMEYLKGGSLAARAQGRPLELDQVKAIMRQVGAALQAAHRAGVVHRDLKPENIFLVPTALGDQVKVLDFGISKLEHSTSVQTTDQVLIGTPLYMSPEQALGHNSEIGPQSDLFSLGSITYELLTGVAPFFTDNVARVVFRIAYEAHAPLAQKRPDLPAEVVQAVEHALKKDRSQRTPDIATFVFELTNQALVEVSDVTSGVAVPNEPVSASMISGETRDASSRPLATPATPRPVASNAPPEPGTLSGKKFVIFALLATVVLAGVVSKVRTDNWKERAVYRASMVDAGWVMLDDGTFVKRDAGEAFDAGTVTVDAGVDDAGAPDAGLVDAGTLDAGAVEARDVRVKELPLTADEKKAWADLQTLLKDEKWETAWNQRGTYRVALSSPGGKRQLNEVIMKIACVRHDLSGLTATINEYRALGVGPVPKKVRQECAQLFSDSSNLDW